MFRGSMVALITPMTADEKIDEQALEALVAFHLEQKTDAIVAVGTTGESTTLSHQEHRHVVKRVVELVKGQVPVIAGTGSNSTAEAIELTRAAQQDGADAALLVAPYYNKPTQEGLFRHYQAIAQAVSIPQILYNVPGRTASDILPETVARLAEIDNIIAIKDATGDLERAREVVQRCGEAMLVYSGEDILTLDILRVGGQGTISVTANVAPALMHTMCAAALAGEYEIAQAVDAQLEALHRTLFSEPNPTAVKWVMAQMGFGHEDGIRLPLLPLSASLQPAVLAAMRQADINIE